MANDLQRERYSGFYRRYCKCCQKRHSVVYYIHTQEIQRYFIFDGPVGDANPSKWMMEEFQKIFVEYFVADYAIKQQGFPFVAGCSRLLQQTWRDTLVLPP